MTLLWTNQRRPTGDDKKKEEPVKEEDRSNDATKATTCRKETLQNIQTELEKERIRRRELEAQISQLTRQKQKQAAMTNKKKANAPSHQDMVALQAQVQGYQQIVNALTAGRPAIDFAIAQVRTSEEATSTSSSILVNPCQALPLHTIRFLEFMPWHPQAMEAALVKEELFEWQVYEKNVWKSELSHFPTFFKALPVIGQATTCNNNNNSNKAVWTNHILTLRFDVCHGSALPHKVGVPTWKWIGEWQVQTTEDPNVTHDDKEEDNLAMYRDEEGWSYATEASHFLLAETSQLPSHYLIAPTCLPPQVLAKESHPNKQTSLPRSLIRRRQWSRPRVLVDYPHACETSVNFLTLLAQSQELLWKNRHLQTCYQKAQLSLANMELQRVHERHQWAKEQEAHQQRLESLKQEHLHQLEALERQRGPPRTQFVPKKVVVDEHDDEEDNAMQCSLSGQLDKPRSLLLHPEDGTMDRRVDHFNKGLPFFGWGKQECRRKTASPAPDVEPCSDCNSIASFEDHSGEDDASLPQFSSSLPPSEDRHKSFLQLWFIGKHPEGGAVTTGHEDVQDL
jgi:hypothetical protein